jgi:nitrite reductase/ring-hydroxylating ferredoxin subunit
MKQTVCRTNDLSPGQMISGQLGPFPLVVIRANDGTLHAMVAKCLHQGGPLDKGKLYEHVSAECLGEYIPDKGYDILKCPWHGYEYDIKTGCVLADPTRRLQTFIVREEGDEIVVELAPPTPHPAGASA